MQRFLKCHIFLTGMPGSGKSSIGKKAAQLAEVPFLDTDSLLEEKAGCSIPEIFAEYGENHFRIMETEMLKSLAQTESAVISTGGGMVMKENNRRIMKEEGIIVFIDRPVENIRQDIDLSSRPLLNAKGIDEVDRLYRERIDIYRESADYIVSNNSTFASAVCSLQNVISGLLL